MEAGVLTLEVLLRECASKLDVSLMGMGRLHRNLVPSEKRLSKPVGMPKVPLGTREEFNKFEEFLGKSDLNLSAVVSIIIASLTISFSYN